MARERVDEFASDHVIACAALVRFRLDRSSRARALAARRRRGSSSTAQFTPPARLLLGPGPSNVHPRVLRAMSHAARRPPRSRVHRDDGGDEARCCARSSRPTNALTIPDLRHRVSAGMEACLVNLLEPGDDGDHRRQRRLRHAHGRHRRARRARSAVRVEAPWGRIVDPRRAGRGARSRTAAPKLVARRARRDVDRRLAAARGDRPPVAHEPARSSSSTA